jgi:hypothetical protein
LWGYSSLVRVLDVGSTKTIFAILDVILSKFSKLNDGVTKQAFKRRTQKRARRIIPLIPLSLIRVAIISLFIFQRCPSIPDGTSGQFGFGKFQVKPPG